MKKIRPSRGESRRRATKLGRIAASNSKYPVHFCLEGFIRSTVPQNLSRKTVGPQLYAKDRIIIVTVDSLSLWQESADQAVVVLNGTFFTGSIRMRKVHRCTGNRLNLCKYSVFRAVICCNTTEHFRKSLSKLIFHTPECFHERHGGFISKTKYTQVPCLSLHHGQQDFIFVRFPNVRIPLWNQRILDVPQCCAPVHACAPGFFLLWCGDAAFAANRCF